jgi:predicted DsbA family dithiol-disulfide isomerase
MMGFGKPPLTIEASEANTVLHWFDFTCPFCYLANSRNEILRTCGLVVVELPFQAHPEVPDEGISIGPRFGKMYEQLEDEAYNAGLMLRWPSRLPNSRYALTVAEWVRRHCPEKFEALRNQLFLCHFGLGENIGDPGLVDRYAARLGVNTTSIHQAMQDGSAQDAVEKSERIARGFGVAGTPAWIIDGRLVSGLQPLRLFEQIGCRDGRIASE